jgi:ATP phosphoribosyltransferase
VLRIVLPKGSLEKATLELFEAADLTVVRSSSVDYRATIDDPRVLEVRILRPQEIPIYVAEGLFDLGITGRDWIEETSSTVVSLGEMRYSKATSNPIRVVAAVAGDSPYESVADLPQGVRVSSEYPALTQRYFESKGINADVRLSYGASEAKIPDIADCVVDITETGRALKAAGLRDDRHDFDQLDRGDRESGQSSDPAKASCHGTTHDPAQRHPRSPWQGLLKLNVVGPILTGC